MTEWCKTWKEVREYERNGKSCTGKSNFEMFTVWLCICCEVLRQWIFQLNVFHFSFHASCSSSFSTSCPCFCFTVVHPRFHATSPPYPAHLTSCLSYMFSIHSLWECGCAPSCYTHISSHVARGLVSKHLLEKFRYWPAEKHPSVKYGQSRYFPVILRFIFLKLHWTTLCGFCSAEMKIPWIVDTTTSIV